MLASEQKENTEKDTPTERVFLCAKFSALNFALQYSAMNY